MGFPDRFPGANWAPIPGCPGLTWADTTDNRREVLHSTEGSSIAGAESAYRTNRSAPHLTVDAARRTIHNHVGMSKAAYSLRNGSEPTETNRDRYTWQVEIVGFAARMGGLPAGQLEWLAENVLRPFADVYGVPYVALDFHPYPPPMRLGAEPWRMSSAEWLRFSGICGHQHVGDGNFHGDPGALNVPHMVKIARGKTEQQKGALMALTDEQQDELFRNARDAKIFAARAYAYAKAGALWGLTEDEAKLVRKQAAQTDPTNNVK